MTICASPTVLAAGSAVDVTSRLDSSRLSLSQGIAQSEKEHGKAISAKFEMKGDVLMLSVYTAKAGLGRDAEHNELLELIGDSTQARWNPEIEVFADAEHLKRSAMQLTLVQSSRISLAEAVDKAQRSVQGKVYSAIPAVAGGAPMYDILVAMPDGSSKHVSVNGNTGSVGEK